MKNPLKGYICVKITHKAMTRDLHDGETWTYLTTSWIDSHTNFTNVLIVTKSAAMIDN